MRRFHMVVNSFPVRKCRAAYPAHMSVAMRACYMVAPISFLNVGFAVWARLDIVRVLPFLESQLPFNLAVPLLRTRKTFVELNVA